MADFDNPLGRFLLDLARIDPAEHHDAIFNACIEQGGSWLRPTATRGHPTTHAVEIHLFDIIGVGADDDEAIRSWIRAAHNSRPDLIHATDGRIDDPLNGQALP